jgi:hypothetical protein
VNIFTDFYLLHFTIKPDIHDLKEVDYAKNISQNDDPPGDFHAVISLHGSTTPDSLSYFTTPCNQSGAANENLITSTH